MAKEVELKPGWLSRDVDLAYSRVCEWAGSSPGSWVNVIAAAVQVGGATISIPKPARHVDILSALRLAGIDPDDPHKFEQGFLLADGRFANRWNARRHAIGSGQIAKAKYGDDLYSEDLW